MLDLLYTPFVRGLIVGLLSAALVDITAWKSFSEAKFNLQIASWRWFQGACMGAASMTGLSAL